MRDRVDDTPSGLAPAPTNVKSARGATRSALLRRWVIVIGVVAIAANAGAAAYDSWRLFADVGRGEASVLTPLRADAIRVLERTLVLSLLGAVAIAALVRQLRRVELGERALRESEERYALAMDAANEGHFDMHLGNGPSFFSEKMVEIFIGASDKPITSREEWLAAHEIHPDDAAAVRAAYDAHLEGLTPRFEIEYRVRRPGGEWRWVHTRARCVRDSEGNPCRMVGSGADITDRKRAEAEKERLEAQLRKAQKLEALGTLAGGIAHDFNNILGAILGYGEMAQTASSEGSDLRRYVDNVMQAGTRAKALVERMLAFRGSGLGERAAVNLQKVVAQTLESVAASLPSTVRLDRRLEAGDAVVIGDATQLHGVVLSLCTNSVQAMPKGGVLEVHLECAGVPEPKSLSHGDLARGPYVQLTVRDTGSGIEPEVLDRIFDPFFTTKGVGEGTGLGLSLVHGIVADAGGAIDVASTRAGTTFTVWLPALATIPAPAQKTDRLPLRGSGQVVMIVDDEPMLVALAEETLAELGYEPVGFQSSQAALDAFAADPQRFDLVLTDEMMPGLTGTELAIEIKRRRPDIPIAIMTGYTDSGVAALARSAGVSEILRKPLQRRDLAESLARVLASAGRH
ncbi:MAG TPA: ATP-binding protein [Gammaproteobacteria bacterium]|nr:ATP-binding protein [Gammaproteobacteria bacterium]